MKKFAITIENKGAYLVCANTKKSALAKFLELGYDVTSNDVYFYSFK